MWNSNYMKITTTFKTEFIGGYSVYRGLHFLGNTLYYKVQFENFKVILSKGYKVLLSAIDPNQNIYEGDKKEYWSEITKFCPERVFLREKNAESAPSVYTGKKKRLTD